MQPPEVERKRLLPAEPVAMHPDQEATPPPASADSDEQCWDLLGSTRVIEGQTPRQVRRPAQPDPAATDHSEPLAAPRAPKDQPAVLGDFRLVRKIGEGAMGAVYLARQNSFDRNVALKVLFPHIASNPKLVERLYREGRVMGQLDHPNIVQAYGVGEDQGWHYIALEFVDGQSMQQWLTKLGKLSIADAVHIILTCARALEYAHSQGIVHRDIKPDNIMITTQGGVKVADLGMVKIDDEDMALTQTGHAVGTPWYMPLEQAKNAKDTDRRSDIYALGCMLYCFLTGLPPFAGKTLLDVIQAKEIGTFPPVRTANPNVPERLDLVIIKMAAKLPKYRYQTCTELIKDLESLELAGPTLTFLEDKPAYASDESKPPSSHDDLRAVPIIDPNVWYVRVKDKEGGSAVHKLATPAVQRMLQEDVLPPDAKASHDPKAGFRSLATYKEFQGQALVKASKQSADQQTERYRSLYKKIEEQAEQRERAKEAETRPAELPWWQQPLAIKIGAAVGGFLLLVLLIWSLSR